MAAGNRSLCQWKCQQVVGREQMWSDHKESCRLHNSKGMFLSLDLKLNFNYMYCTMVIDLLQFLKSLH